jgi:hypothetical protein
LTGYTGLKEKKKLILINPDYPVHPVKNFLKICGSLWQKVRKIPQKQVETYFWGEEVRACFFDSCSPQYFYR